MMLSRWEVFMLGWQFHAAIVGHASDARDVGRVMTCHFWPEEFHSVADDIHWTQTKDVGLRDAMGGIKKRLDAQDGEEVEESST